MWVNPKYADARTDERQPRKPPVPSGRHVAAVDRPGFRSGPNQQLRIGVDAVEDGPLYINIRVWEQSSDGGWYPGRAGVTIRAREGEAVIEAIHQALALVDDPLIEAQVREHNRRVRAGHAGEPVDYTPTNPASTPPRPVRARVTSSTPAPARAPTRRKALTHHRPGQGQKLPQQTGTWTGSDPNTVVTSDLTNRVDFDEEGGEF